MLVFEVPNFGAMLDIQTLSLIALIAMTELPQVLPLQQGLCIVKGENGSFT